jgi:outer membrane lipoprotein-sorting protein
MSRGSASVALALLGLILLASPACLVRRRVITRNGGRPAQALLVADKAALITQLSRLFNAVQNFSATVDMTPALGSAEKSKITEYKDVRGYILYRRPDDIRIIGLYPVVRNKAFDMVSNGSDFRLFITARQRFIVGRNQLTTPSPNNLENLRPQHFVDALLVHPPKEAERPMLANLTDEDGAHYILHLIADGSGGPRLGRSIWFDRLNLALVRQVEYDNAGNILSDARYNEWQTWDGVPFPKQLQINRPRDEYGVVLKVVKMDVNKGVTDDKFVLEQPAGSTLRVIGQPPANMPAAVPAGGNGSPQPAPSPKARDKKQ